MNVIVLQNKVYQDIARTLREITNQLMNCNSEHVDFIILPEMFMSPYELESFTLYKQTKSGEVVDFLRNIAIKYHAYVIGGSIPFFDNNNLYNTSFVFDRKGNIIYRYDKLYLFEVTYPDGSTFRERDVLKAGNKPGIFETEFGKMGLMICFDIRFPELAEQLTREGAKVIFVPAAFNTFTGPLHWQVTLRARAIDNQLFVIACSPSRDSVGDYDVYGHSIVISPLGKVIQELDEFSGVIKVDVDLNEIAHARNVIPIIKNKRS